MVPLVVEVIVMRKAELDDVLRDTSRRRSGVTIVLRTNDTDFIGLAVRAMQNGGDMAFVHDASTFENLEQPIDLYAKVVSVM
jgi:hypothetical protein